PRIVWRQRDRLLRRLSGTLRDLGQGRAVGVQQRVRDRDAGPGPREAGVQSDRLLVEGERLSKSRRIVLRENAGGLLALEEGLVARSSLRRPPGQLLLPPRPETAPSACATRVAMSDCTWNTSLNAASNGCCQREAGAPLSLISTSSGLTWTRFAPPVLSHR